MPNFQITNLPYHAKDDPRLAESFQQIQDAINNLAQQTASVPVGQQAAPSAPSALSVTGSGGIFDIQIQDNNPANTGIAPDYFLEYSTTPGFTPSATIQVHIGPVRNTRLSLGNQTLYWRVYSQNGRASQTSGKTYFGSQSSPTPVAGGGAISGPAIQPSAGSGTGPTTGQAPGVGYGILPVR